MLSLGDGRAPLVADGAMGTMLQAAGLMPGDWAAPWSLSHPEAVRATHAAYVAAGADLLLTNSFGATEQAILRASVAVARQAEARYVVGSLGPGADENEATPLAEAGVDALWLETQLSLADALDSLRACQRVAPHLPLIVTFSFHRPDSLSHAGDSPATIARALAENGATAIGANCGVGPPPLAPILAAMADACSLPLALKPNAGPATAPLGPAEWVAALSPLLVPRVRIVGGCCGTTPAHIAALAAIVRRKTADDGG